MSEVPAPTDTTTIAPDLFFSSTLPLSHGSLTSHRTSMMNLDDGSSVPSENSYAESVASSTHTEITADTDFSRGNSPPLDSAAFDRSESHAEHLQRLHNALERSDQSNCWDDMAGILLWIGLTASTASRKSNGKVLRKYFSALTVRVSMFLCFEHPQALHATLLRMEAINKALRKESEDAWGLGESKDVPRKKMKT